MYRIRRLYIFNGKTKTMLISMNLKVAFILSKHATIPLSPSTVLAIHWFGDMLIFMHEYLKVNRIILSLASGMALEFPFF